jgi:hypothetical protein
MLPGGELLIIDGKRHCWECAAKAKKQKDKCVRIPLIELQAVADLLAKGMSKLSQQVDQVSGAAPSGSVEVGTARQILAELLESKVEGNG